MTLASIAGFHEWVERDKPPPAAQRMVLDFIIAAGEAPWLAPSVPINELSDHHSQFRTAAFDIPDFGTVTVHYRETYGPRPGAGSVAVFAVLQDG